MQLKARLSGYHPRFDLVFGLDCKIDPANLPLLA